MRGSWIQLRIQSSRVAISRAQPTSCLRAAFAMHPLDVLGHRITSDSIFLKVLLNN